MEQFELLLHGMNVIMNWHDLILMLFGLVLGVFVGVLPGLGGPNGVAILLPLTFSMTPVSAIIMLSCIYWGALFGGSITSILFNIPGDSTSVATTFDGFPMAQQGKAAEALTLSFTGAFVGALVGILLLTFSALALARFSLKFGPPEFFGVYLLTFCSFIGSSKGSPMKTILATLFGFAVAEVGMDSMSGTLRLTFGQVSLIQGVDFVVAVIGLFGIGEILFTIEKSLTFKGMGVRLTPKDVFRTWAKLPKYWASLVRSCIVGCWMGVTPGGATAASFMGYGIEDRFSKGEIKFGEGNPRGVLSPETAAHASGASSLLPMLALGIPGSATAAVLLGGLITWGLEPGPLLFREQPDFVWGLVASMYISNVVGLVVCLSAVPFFASIMRISFSTISALIIMVCAVGAYVVNNSTADIWIMLVFGVIGYVLKKLKYPLAPLVLAIVLGRRTEDAFRQSMLSSDGSLSIFWSNPLVTTLMALAILLAVYPMIRTFIDTMLGHLRRR
ncbi:MAG TPA: tripartite tricarboxylate transporter permease [Castellaniella sp.]|uniref:tripartite tricarboxylate transporter permease n=1 Tax=Castellaniella sp. TaxID=1955812 RepID=UPI002F0E6A3D